MDVVLPVDGEQGVVEANRCVHDRLPSCLEEIQTMPADLSGEP